MKQTLAHNEALAATARRSPSHADALLLAVPLVVGPVLAALFLLGICGGEKTNFEEFALPKGTQSYYAEYNGHKIHCKGISDAGSCIEGWRSRGCHEVALWIGNSQVHGVNQLKPGQESASPMLFRRLGTMGLDFLTFSFPNSNFQEEYVLFEYLRRRLRPKVLILPVVFISFRETGIRDAIAKALVDLDVKASLMSTKIGERILTEYGHKAATEGGDLAALRGTIQEHSERFFNDWLAKNCELWEARPQARGWLQTSVYRLRNAVLGVTPQSKRKMIKGRYQDNMGALEAMIKSAVKDNTRVVLYTAPIRHDVELPYLIEEYEACKSQVKDLAEQTGAVYANLESVVPAESWGQKDSTALDGELELDFFHFRASGHSILAEALARLIEPQVLGRAR
ncbi:MAG: hypothetical protein ACLP5H_01475 [Desulfomonilaceae bacterium]